MRVRDIRRAQRVVQRIEAKELPTYHCNLDQKRELKGRFTHSQKKVLRTLAIILMLIWGGFVGIIILVWHRGLLEGVF